MKSHHGITYSESEKYDYVLEHLHTEYTGIFFDAGIEDYVALRNGKLLIGGGYAWDGPTWAIDTENFMRGSLIHDALYQLMREGQLDSSYRKQADVLLYHTCREDGMSWWRASYVYQMVRWFGASAAK